MSLPDAVGEAFLAVCPELELEALRAANDLLKPRLWGLLSLSDEYRENAPGFGKKDDQGTLEI